MHAMLIAFKVRALREFIFLERKGLSIFKVCGPHGAQFSIHDV